jgi:hypothetical protein
LGRNGLSSSNGRFCDNRPFARSARFPGHKGRIAIVTDVGCGMRWTFAAQETSALEADGEVVWSGPLDAEVKLATMLAHRVGDGGNQADHRGEHEASR